MKILPDGTLEGTPEELAAYERAKACGGCPVVDEEAVRRTIEHIENHPPFVAPDGWSPTGGARPQSGAAFSAIPCAACSPQNGGSGVCGCVRPDRDCVPC